MKTIPLVGYADRFSVAPGETIAFKISSTTPYRAKLVRVISGDPNPDGPGIIEQDIPADFTADYPARLQPLQLGSYLRVSQNPALDGLNSFTLLATVWPTTPQKSAQSILAKWNAVQTSGFVLGIDQDGAYVLLGDGQGKSRRLTVGKALVERRWYRIWASYDHDSRRLEIGQRPLRLRFDANDKGSANTTLDFQPLLGCDEDLLAAALGSDPVKGHYNGKLEYPALLNAVLSEREILSVAAGGDHENLLAAWDFSREIPSQRAVDIGPHNLHGRLINLPARGMKSSAWDGSEMSWRHRPEHYAAIHFHDDDLYDCGWQTDFSFTVPQDLRSGVYAARLEGDGSDSSEMIPFFVRPTPGKPQSKICVLIPSYTYIVYANYARFNTDDDYCARVKAWNARPWTADDSPQFGWSTYNFHSDGSGICYSSRLRPIITMRSGYISVVNLPGSGLRHFPADSHLWSWLEHQGHEFDVLTDEDLHAEGLAAIKDYKVVLTPAHPEYHTPQTLDALQDYINQGGRLMYLGGNGFYWKVAVSDEHPGAVEIRRGEGGIRAWAAEPGEYYNSFDGRYGGLWRRNDRPPQQLCGVGFTAQGLLEGSYYRRTGASYRAEYAWMFEGIDDDIIGDFGLSGGGAAGFELDRADTRLGTPLNAVILACSEQHQDHFVTVPEELLTHTSTWSGETPEALIRSEIVYFETAKGGAVFSVGSICYCGSLPWNHYDNNISRLTDNVLRRFRDG